MNWIGQAGVIANLILEIIKIFKKQDVKDLGEELKNAKTSEEKKAVAAKISKHLYS